MDVTNSTERIDWLQETYDLSRKNAAALLVAECGYSASGIASALDVTEQTARNYLETLESRIGKGVTESVPKSVRYPTYPGDTPKSDVDYSGDYVDIPASMEDREVSLNRGAPLHECYGFRKA